MTNGLLEAGATLKWVYDPDPAKVAAYCKCYPQAAAAACEAQIFDDPEVRLIAGACVPGDGPRLESAPCGPGRTILPTRRR